MSYNNNNNDDDQDPLGPPENTQHLDLSKLSPQELKIYKMYGKLPTTQQILSSKFQDKKYFDSGDYAMQKQQQKKQQQGGSGVGVSGGSKSGGFGNINMGGGAIPMRHPNAERMKEMSNRNSISASNAQVFANGKSSLLHEATINKVNELENDKK